MDARPDHAPNLNPIGLSKVARKSANAHEPPRASISRNVTANRVIQQHEPALRALGGYAHVAEPRDRPRNMATKSAARPINQRRDISPARHIGPRRVPSPPRFAMRKQAYPELDRNARQPFVFAAPLPSRIQRATKSPTIRPRWFVDDDEPSPSSVRRQRALDDVGGRPSLRMVAGASAGSQRRSQAAVPKSSLVRKPGHSIPMPQRDGFVVGPGGIIQPLHVADNEHTGEDDPAADAARTGLSAKGSRKIIFSANSAGQARPQTAMKSAAHTKAARKIGIPRANNVDPVLEESESSSDLERDTDRDKDEDVEQLMAALDAITLTTARLKEYRQLPFLLRNLRKGFRNRCQLANVPLVPKAPPDVPVTVLYRYDLNDDNETVTSAESLENDGEHQYEERKGRMVEWDCPICQLHGHFDTREMLDFHLRRDHGEVKVSWTEGPGSQTPFSRLVLLVPDIDDESSSEEEDSDDDEEDKHAVQGEESRAGSPRTTEHDLPRDPHTEVELPQSVLAADVCGQGAVPRTPSPVSSCREPSEPQAPVPAPVRVTPPSPVKIIKKFRAYSPTVSESTLSTQRSRSSTGQEQRARARARPRSSQPGRYPTPPPQSDPLGPAAQYPYLPEGREGGDAHRSCRPGGPRIYDLLNTLPLEPFGLLSWVIVDREEELFEMDDVRDEDKVILALWNRWIMLNRPSFVSHDYCKGVIDFVDEYWEMIHRAAGWGALRAFLLVLLANKFLDVSEVIRVLKHYETHTGMDEWYQDEDGYVDPVDDDDDGDSIVML